jgi:hypothetical protein
MFETAFLVTQQISSATYRWTNDMLCLGFV